MLIEDIYNREPRTVTSDVKVPKVIEMMFEYNINGFIVVNGKKAVKGIVSLQDIAAATVPEQFKENLSMAMAMYRRGFFNEMTEKLKDKTAGDIMRKNFILVSPQTNIMAVMADFLKNDLYIVPVVVKGELVGVITRTEIRQALATSFGLFSGGEMVKE